MLTVKAITAKTIQTVQEHKYSFPGSDKAIPANFASSKFSLHSSTNLSTSLFLHLQISQSKYSPTLHDLSHSHSQLLGYLSSFQRCLLLQKLLSNLHLHLHVSCSFMCLVSLVLDIRLIKSTFKFFTASGTHIFACGSLIFYNYDYIYLF